MEKGNPLMLAMPSDHLLDNEDAFQEIVVRGILAASAGHIVTFGIKSTRPEPGFGYIHHDKECYNKCFDVQKFVEKPDSDSVDTMFKSGDYFFE